MGKYYKLPEIQEKRKTATVTQNISNIFYGIPLVYGIEGDLHI